MNALSKPTLMIEQILRLDGIVPSPETLDRIDGYLTNHDRTVFFEGEKQGAGITEQIGDEL